MGPVAPDSPYARLVRRIVSKLKAAGLPVAVDTDATGRFGTRCPCCGGQLLITFRQKPLGMVFSSGYNTGDIPDQCSNGCTAGQILEALA